VSHPRQARPSVDVDGRRAVASARGASSAQHAIEHLRRGCAAPDALLQSWAGLGGDLDAQRAFMRQLQKVIERTRCET